jgi:hydrogenase maturation protease
MTKKILVAGIGNSWLSDDGFGGAVVKALEQRELPPEAAVFDFGTGGLDLAYEIMRGYDGVIFIDVSRQGGEPGTLYVMEATEADAEAGIEDGQVLNPHGMDPRTVLRFVKTLGGWPGKVVIVACEPAVVEEMGIALSDAVNGAVTGAVDLVLETVEELRHDAAYAAVE